VGIMRILQLPTENLVGVERDTATPNRKMMEAEERGSWGEAREENCGTQVTAVLLVPPIADCIG